MTGKDPRVDFVVTSLNSAVREVRPGSPDAPITEDDKQGIAVCLRLFDKLLPLFVRQIRIEVARQEREN